jgi:hypothetical protein
MHRHGFVLRQKLWILVFLRFLRFTYVRRSVAGNCRLVGVFLVSVPVIVTCCWQWATGSLCCAINQVQCCVGTVGRATWSNLPSQKNCTFLLREVIAEMLTSRGYGTYIQIYTVICELLAHQFSSDNLYWRPRWLVLLLKQILRKCIGFIRLRKRAGFNLCLNTAQFRHIIKPGARLQRVVLCRVVVLCYSGLCGFSKPDGT